MTTKERTTEEHKNLCTLMDDARLIDGGPGAFGAHAARLAGLSKELQEEIAEVAVRVARAAFANSKAAGATGFRLRLSIADSIDSVEVLMEGEGWPGAERSRMFEGMAELAGASNAPENPVRWRAQQGACLLAITKTPDARNAALHPGSVCSH